MLEINSAPDRRDLNDVHARAAAAAGVRILIDSDAHGVNTLGITRWGIATARRAWLTKDDVANTLPWKQVRAAAQARAARAQRAEQARQELARRRRGRPRRGGRARAPRARAPAKPGAGSSSAARSAGRQVVGSTSRASSARASASAAYGPGASVVTSRQPSASASSWATP